jgi:hypothetical protein
MASLIGKNARPGAWDRSPLRSHSPVTPVTPGFPWSSWPRSLPRWRPVSANARDDATRPGPGWTTSGSSPPVATDSQKSNRRWRTDRRAANRASHFAHAARLDPQLRTNRPDLTTRLSSSSTHHTRQPATCPHCPHSPVPSCRSPHPRRSRLPRHSQIASHVWHSRGIGLAAGGAMVVVGPSPSYRQKRPEDGKIT